MNTNKITNLSNGTLSGDAVAFGQLSGYYASTVPLNSITVPSAAVSLNSKKITNLANGTVSTDAVAFG